MSNMSKYAEERTLLHLLSGSVYLALYTTNPGEMDTGSEVKAASYKRQAVSFLPPTVEAGRTSCINSAEISFPKAEEDFGTITHLGIRDAQTGGNLLYYKALSAPVDVLKGGILKIKAGDLKVSQD